MKENKILKSYLLHVRNTAARALLTATFRGLAMCLKRTVNLLTQTKRFFAKIEE